MISETCQFSSFSRSYEGRGTTEPHVHSETVKEGFVGRFTGSFDADNLGPCAPVVNSFFGEEVDRVQLLTFRTSPCFLSRA